MRFLLLLACMNTTVPAAPRATAPVAGFPADAGAGDPAGSWYVVWDRSATGWSPPRFNGVMVLTHDSMLLTFQESGARFEVERLEIEGATFEMVGHAVSSLPPDVVKASGEDPAPHPVEIRGFVDGDRMLAYMRSGAPPEKYVPWAPLTGKRAPAPTGAAR